MTIRISNVNWSRSNVDRLKSTMSLDKLIERKEQIAKNGRASTSGEFAGTCVRKGRHVPFTKGERNRNICRIAWAESHIAITELERE